MANVIIFSVFGAILVIAFFAGLGGYINGEKGLSITKGLIIGGLFPIIGILALSLQKQSSKNLVDEMYDRGLIKKEEHDETMEVLISDLEKKL